MTTYNAKATREGRYWVVNIEGVGVTQARSLTEAEEMARDLVCVMREVAPEDVDVQLTPVLDPEFESSIELARSLSETLQSVQQASALSWRLVVTQLRETGLSGREVAEVLDVTPQRVSQLAKDSAPAEVQRQVSEFIARSRDITDAIRRDLEPLEATAKRMSDSVQPILQAAKAFEPFLESQREVVRSLEPMLTQLQKQADAVQEMARQARSITPR